jgi:hypothetical protein
MWTKRLGIGLAAALTIGTVAGVLVLSSRRGSEPAGPPGDCHAGGRTIVTTPPGTSTSTYAPQPTDDSSFDAAGTTWEPDLSTYPIDIDPGAARLCWVGGTVRGAIPSDMTWEAAHTLNQPCLRMVATEWMVIDGLRCSRTDDGLRPREISTGAQNVTMTIRDTYLTDIHDDCLENDGIIGGVVRDGLWDGCYTGISERPSAAQGSFPQPSSETLTLDHMLIGLQSFPYGSGLGENALFKWSDSANALIIKCSVFKVDSTSVNGADTMAIPGMVDDSACPEHPTTLVWLGGGTYPGHVPPGIDVTSDVAVWDRAVAAWERRHADASGVSSVSG